MDPIELISKLKGQHRVLRADLSVVLNNFNSSSDSKILVADLLRFKNNLAEHLRVENDDFYPDYLEKQGKKGYDLNNTKKFIAEMVEIGEVIAGFLKRYETPVAINEARSNFEKDLQEIISVLNVRIETEEEGVFALYLLM
jgi:regulator of sigma D